MAETQTKRRRMGEKKGASFPQTTSIWPVIKPKPNLQIVRLKDSDLFTVQNFLTSVESKAFIKAAEAIGFAHQGSLGPTKGEACRDNDRISVNDPLLADTIWVSGLNQLFSDIKIRGKVAVGLNPNIRFYRYKVGQRFGRHIDESVNIGEGKHTHYTLLIYLSGSVCKGKNDLKNSKDSPSEPLVGGETVFYGSRNSVVAEVAPAEGMALLHIHGDKCMLHEARNVTKGVKYVFRSDVVFA
ncbi:Prolyl 4-hydroxylase, alpha subunit [Parasponia andersonii]|uniref:Prolyl 4-hydroxylase, alpha subunit n=1 Tax=Parasponia andersonii TaxID=3476 RepID=A0A2P5D9J5_PARAD|nr:Prolyl 4-hydroxylase, alpha subunit [Parasponia andersonii]